MPEKQRNVKKTVLSIVLVVLTIALVSCSGSGGSQVYNNLQDQKLVMEDSAANQTSGGQNDSASDSGPDGDLCELKPYCCGEFPDEEMHYREMQQKAIAESDPEMCSVIPEEPLVVDDCPDMEAFVYYNKTYCLEMAGGGSE